MISASSHDQNAQNAQTKQSEQTKQNTQNEQTKQSEQKLKLIAVCGNIGSGKSTFIKNFLKENPEY